MVWLKGCFVLLPELPQNIIWNETTRYKIRKKKPDGNLLLNEPERVIRHVCTSCSYTFSSKSVLCTHMQVTHAKLNGFVDNTTLEQGTLHCYNPGLQLADEFRCEECNITFDKEHSFIIHIESAHEKLEEIETNGTLEQDTFYQPSPSKNSDDKFRCEECDIIFDEECSFIIHNQSAHEKLENFMDNGTFEQETIDLLNPYQYSTASFNCRDCDIQFDQKSVLTNHNQAVHQKEKPFRCTKCDGAFRHKFKLIKHINRVHESIKPFKCTQCDWAFAEKTDLTRHVDAIHNQFKPYRCTGCDRSFSAKQNMERHVKIYHKQSKDCKCLQCDWTFLSNKALTQHVNIVHGGLKLSHAINEIESLVT